MSFRGTASALIFIVLIVGGVIIFQSFLNLSYLVFMGLVFILGCIYIIWSFLVSKKHEDLRQPVFNTLTGNVKNPISHYLGLGLMVVGGILALGNRTGAFMTFPYAGSICFTVGAGFFAYSGSA